MQGSSVRQVSRNANSSSKGGAAMSHAGRVQFTLVVTIVALIAMPGAGVHAQDNPYRVVEGWAQLPDGRKWGSTAAVDVDANDHIWVAERCGANSCADSNLPPVLEFDPSGKLLRSFGAGLFVFPHGIGVDREGNVWVTDGQGKDGKGHQVFKFSADGKILMTLGKAGVTGDGPDTFNQPSDVIVAPNGDVFVADGHGGNSNARIMKFSKDGKFIKSWGKKGIAPGEFDTPHGLAFDSKGRLFVADRNNNRIQIFDQEGNFIEQWTQFSRPSGIFIDAKDNIYVADSESNSVRRHPGWKRGIRVGNISDEFVTAFIPDPVENAKGTSAAEGVAADSKGNIYGAEVGPKMLKKYVKK